MHRRQRFAKPQIPAEELFRVDACHTAYRRLLFYDFAQALVFQSRFLRVALDAGEPVRIAMGLTTRAGTVSAGGGPARASADAIFRKAMELVEQHKLPALVAHTKMLAGIMHWGNGLWQEGRNLCAEAENVGAEDMTFLRNDLYTLHHFTSDCLMFLGEWRELGRRLPLWIAEARRRGDLMSAGDGLVHLYVPYLATGAVEQARAVVEEATAIWPLEGAFGISYWCAYGRGEVALYRGDVVAAYEELKRIWSALSRGTYFKFVQVLWLLLVHLRARLAVAAAAARPVRTSFFGARARYLRAAQADVRRLQRARVAWSSPLARSVRAGIASVRGRQAEALEQLAAAEAEFAAADMSMYAAAAQRQRGQLLGGAEGEALVREADARMREQDVREPDRVARMLVPGLGVDPASTQESIQ